MTQFLPYQSQGWHGRIAKDWLDEFTDLNSWLNAHPGEPVVNFPSREVHRVETPRGAVYVKILHNGSGGDACDSFDLVGNLKWFVRPSRALAILRISQDLLDEGFICPTPILAARRRGTAGWPTDLFISRECRVATLAQWLQQAPPLAHVRATLGTVARELRRLHDAGFVHGDCTPYNLALTERGTLVLFDNDRTTHRPALLHRKRLEWRSVAGFGMRLMQIMQDPQVLQEFLACYSRPEEAERIAAFTLKRLRAKGLDALMPTDWPARSP